MAYVPPALANVGVENSPLGTLAADSVDAGLAINSALDALRAAPTNRIHQMALRNAVNAANPLLENLGAALADAALSEDQRGDLQDAYTELNNIMNAARGEFASVLELANEGNAIPAVGNLAAIAAAAGNGNYVGIGNGNNGNAAPEAPAANNIPVGFIKEYVKQTKVPLMYDLEQCELVVAADRKGLMKGYLEARAPSLQLLSDQVKRLVREEFALRGAKAAVQTRRSELKTAKNISSSSLKDYISLKNKLDSITKKKESYRACMMAGKPDIYGVPCIDRFREYERQEAELRPQVEAAEQATQRSMNYVAGATAQKQEAKSALAATRAATTIKPSKGLFGFLKRGGTRRRARKTLRRRNTRRAL